MVAYVNVVWPLPSPNPVDWEVDPVLGSSGFQYKWECHTSNDCVEVCKIKGFHEGGICSDYDKKCICNGKIFPKSIIFCNFKGICGNFLYLFRSDIIIFILFSEPGDDDDEFDPSNYDY